MRSQLRRESAIEPSNARTSAKGDRSASRGIDSLHRHVREGDRHNKKGRRNSEMAGGRKRHVLRRVLRSVVALFPRDALSMSPARGNELRVVRHVSTRRSLSAARSPIIDRPSTRAGPSGSNRCAKLVVKISASASRSVSGGRRIREETGGEVEFDCYFLSHSLVPPACPPVSLPAPLSPAPRPSSLYHTRRRVLASANERAI